MEAMHPSTCCAGNARPKRARGFTLIELVVVVAVVAILAALALPAFFEQVRKSRRSDAITEIYRASQAQERFRAGNTTYSDNLANNGADPLSLFTNATASMTYNLASGHYSITVSNVGRATYTFTADALGSQQGDTNCRTLVMAVAGGLITYNSTNSVPAANTGAANDRCWNR